MESSKEGNGFIIKCRTCGNEVIIKKPQDLLNVFDSDDGIEITNESNNKSLICNKCYSYIQIRETTSI